MSDGIAPRVVAARVLALVVDQGRSLKTELAAALPTLEDVRDRALVEAICFAVLRRRPVYEAALTRWLARPLGRGDAQLRGLLMVGFAQLDVLKVPPYAALSATVDACRVLGWPHRVSFVNAVLRRAQRERLPVVSSDAAWPRWLAERIRADWGEQAEAIFDASLKPAPMWLRVNLRYGDRHTYVQRLQAAGLEAVPSGLVPEALALDCSMPVLQLPGFQAGEVSVQDLSAQQVAALLSPAPHARLLDACAAPGGKAAHLLERAPTLCLTALDVDMQRLRRVAETCDRIHVKARLCVADATDLAAWWDGEAFDAVLLDAPCSATGVVRRQPDVLLHRRAEDLLPLLNIQSRLLDACWRTLRPGGVLVYVTCSVLRAENQAQLEAFLARTADACAEDPGDVYGQPAGLGRQRLPGEQGGDGFFYARLIKDI
ncbi:16S rRNA (cytosine(967)-C(5))-methyltransferase RsmB [Xylella fastidiosa subsp. multiplex]|uniref:16S rRNA (cytosine(967)-C(5))-methyltransferase n=1 Tax=Xylella fastidiosa subsp. multiplex TaxID=644357 RepID=A0AAW6HSI5_XYLFS|nr:16S rRNA (cytosine(967)-C(5))-methyltransferase RsmB [Xylella fastidiosa subsp. multiplex]MDC6407442.1 16S rRNA (cytosine(967)-C(5))-methyltransferase RsmB [Xylella fastidiosa subsp. multiplex]MDD0936189.1 16S rRNA (cytosine(967)-C(5))-methyltransferase RsmB [Xylella fastidiosa subsp. multiplex]MSS68575.1 16S rRNA (cytosine(967)-C(5))-methyltransferase RsmB [Xylella fastidiosa subsp. multiplex]